MARKVFISFLGTGNYSACKYCRDNFKSEELRFVQEATLKYLQSQEQWTVNDVAYIMLTEQAERCNWINDGHLNRETKEIIKVEGLESRINKVNFPFKVEAVRGIPNGNTEGEMWEIFDRIFSLIEDSDQLYFDITHAFRYLPMMALVLCNYAKFLKNITICDISYGNFEGRNKVTNEAQIMSLQSIIALQEWTDAAANYVQHGYVEQLVSLTYSEIKPILIETQGKDKTITNLRSYINYINDIVNQHRFCRGKDIVKADTFKKLNDSSQMAMQAQVIPAIQPIIQELNKSFAHYHNNENIQNGFKAVDWCLKNNLHQQAITLLQETMFTFFCMRYGLDWENQDDRDLISSVFTIKELNLAQENWNDTAMDNIDKTLQLLEKLNVDISKQGQTNILNIFSRCRDIRNDFNHAGFRKNPLSASTLKKAIDEVVKDFLFLQFD